MESFPPQPRYASARRRAQWVCRLLVLQVVVSSASLVFAWSRLKGWPALPPGAKQNPVSFYGLIQSLLLLAKLFAWLLTAALFLWWVHRAYANLEPLGARDLHYTPTSAVVVFLIPFAYPFIPLRVVQELWLKSEPPGTETGTEEPPPWFIAWWGNCWLVYNFICPTGLAASAEAVKQQPGWLQVQIFVEAWSIATALLAVRCVQAIDRRQAESGNRQPQLDQPPPPPLYQ